MHEQASNGSKRRHHSNETSTQLRLNIITPAHLQRNFFREKESHMISEGSKYVECHRAHNAKQMLICLCNLPPCAIDVHYKHIVISQKKLFRSFTKNYEALCLCLCVAG